MIAELARHYFELEQPASEYALYMQQMLIYMLQRYTVVGGLPAVRFRPGGVRSRS